MEISGNNNPIVPKQHHVLVSEISGTPNSNLWIVGKWITISYRWCNTFCIVPEHFCYPLPPHQSNNSAQYGALRYRCWSALKTVKPYYGNRYQISLSNRFCHPMKNCWQHSIVLFLLSIVKTLFGFSSIWPVCMNSCLLCRVEPLQICQFSEIWLSIVRDSWEA